MTIDLEIWLYNSAEGFIVRSDGLLLVFILPKKPCFSNSNALAVVATNDPPRTNLALGPKVIPLGFKKNKLAVLPVEVRSVPKISDRLLPVTRVMILTTPGSKKVTVAPSTILKSEKL
nr:hypothetical protein [Stenomitos frigidus]